MSLGFKSSARDAVDHAILLHDLEQYVGLKDMVSLPPVGEIFLYQATVLISRHYHLYPKDPFLFLYHF